MADINDFSPKEEAQPFTLVNPVTGEDLVSDDDQPMRIFAYGHDSSIFNTAQSEIKSRNRDKKLTDAQVEKCGIELLARCTTKFDSVQINGEQPEGSFADAKKLYTDQNFIKEQVADFVYDRTVHLGNSEET